MNLVEILGQEHTAACLWDLLQWNSSNSELYLDLPGI